MVPIIEGQMGCPQLRKCHASVWEVVAGRAPVLSALRLCCRWQRSFTFGQMTVAIKLAQSLLTRRIQVGFRREACVHT